MMMESTKLLKEATMLSTDRVKLFNDVIHAIKNFTQDTEATMRELINVTMKEWYVEHKCSISQKVDEIIFKTNIITDDQYVMLERIEDVSCIVQATQSKVSPITTVESFSPKIIMSLACRAIQILFNHAGELQPSIFTFEAGEVLTNTVQNIKSMSAAIATTLHITHDMVSLVYQTELCHAGSTPLGTREALWFYNQLYWLTRDTLVTITRIPGPWCRNTADQQIATATLHHLIHNPARSSNMEVCITNGDGYAGMMETIADKWLPAISLGSSALHPQPLLSLSLGVSLNNNHDSTLALTCWFNFFGHKYPFLILHNVPLHACPCYPDPFMSPPSVTVDIADEAQDIHISGYEGIQILISWIGCAVLASATTSVR